MNNEVTKKVLTSGKPAPNTCNTKLVISCKSKLLGRLELWNGWRWKTTATLADGFPWPQYDCPVPRVGNSQFALLLKIAHFKEQLI